MSDNYVSFEINIVDELGFECPFTSRFRSIQTNDLGIAREVMKDIEGLVKKYGEQGCHIGR